MSQIGTIVTAQEVPSAVINNNTTANAFMVGVCDWGPAGASGVSATPLTSLTQAMAVYGQPNGGLVQTSRNSTTVATLYDSADAFFREGGANLYVSRVLGPSPTMGSIALQDASGSTAATLTATYYGAGSSAINVLVANSGSAYTVTLQDGSGNALAVSPSFLNTSPKTDLIGWAKTTNLVTATTGNSNLPKTASVATPLSAGASGTTTSLGQWSAALSGLGPSLGPGQVMAPGQTDTAMGGIWSALANHAQDFNRVALLDGTDGNTAAQAITEVNTAKATNGLGAAVQGYCGIWTGSLQIPGITSGTTRVIPASPVVAALCARADNLGNPNLAPAGTSYPLNYVSGINTAYTDPLYGDIANLNSAGVNVFYNQLNTLQNFGFVSAYALPSNDAIYWQLNHARLRMAIIQQANIVAQPFQFGQLDGQNQTISAFAGALGGMLLGFYSAGALFGANASQAFTVNASPAINTPTSLAAGNLIAIIAVRMSPYAQLVQITVNAVPISQQLAQTA